ncbi:MAG: 4Fe-4S binding protein [Desulfobacterota bacterium]|nr:4Fe-4S binding protein [Thermodesulfobacteriota bacterium]
MTKQRIHIVPHILLCPAIPNPQYTALLWREQHPVWHTERCFQCGTCFLCCPDAAITLRNDGYYDMIPERCKGCGICAGECPNEAIAMQPGP